MKFYLDLREKCLKCALGDPPRRLINFVRSSILRRQFCPPAAIFGNLTLRVFNTSWGITKALTYFNGQQEMQDNKRTWGEKPKAIQDNWIKRHAPCMPALSMCLAFFFCGGGTVCIK